MSEPRSLRIFLDEMPLRRAQAGKFNLIGLICNAFENCGFSVELCLNSPEARLNSAADPGYSLFHMDDPFHPRALTLRRAYYYPFWRIEKSAKRWKWEIAQTPFEPERIDAEGAEKFCRFWRQRLFGTASPETRRDGMVYVPLQGRLLEQRSFQSLSPLAMIKAVLQHDTERQICVGIHPGESYTPEELGFVRALTDGSDRIAITEEPMESLLSRCDYVATENSSVALAGYFFHKPAVLFAQIDFHHIAANVAALGTGQAMAQVAGMTPDYDRYMFWFLKQTAINGGSAEAEDQIIEMVRRRGWEV